MSDLVFLNGIDATTGKENIKPLPPEQLSEAVQREPVDEQSLRELKWWYERSTCDGSRSSLSAL